MSEVIRVQKNRDNPYVMMNKFALEDPRLSFKAKGIMAYLLSKPDDWKVIVKDLVNRAKDGEKSVYSGLVELKKYGYLTKKPVRMDGKIHHWESTVYEVPQTLDTSLLAYFVQVENLQVENRVHNNNNITNKRNKEKSVSTKIAQAENFEQREYDEDFLNSLYEEL